MRKILMKSASSTTSGTGEIMKQLAETPQKKSSLEENNKLNLGQGI